MDVRAFVSNPALADNTVNKTAPFGELSSYALTYTKARQNYVNSPANGIELVVFSCRGTNSAEVVMPSALANQLLAVGNYVHTSYASGTIPRNINKSQFISTLTAQFPTCSNFVVGELLAGSLTTKNMPDHIAFSVTISGVVHTAKLWFSSQAIETQYDLYSIQVFPPVQSLSSLSGTASAVTAAMVANQSAATVVGQIQAATSGHPASSIGSYELPLVLGESVVQTTWVVVCWGNRGGDDAIIKEAIRAYLTANSTGQNWTTAYPALYTESEFMIVPMWGYLPASQTDYGTYAGMINANDMRAAATSRMPNSYQTGLGGSTYLNTNMVCLPVQHRAMMLTAVGHPSNPTGKTKLDSIYPDYINVDTQSLDFGRMSQTTQDFVTELSSALEAARDYMPNDTVPNGYTRHVTNGRVYLGVVIGSYRYKILTRYSYANLI